MGRRLWWAQGTMRDYIGGFETPEKLNWKISSHFVFLQGEIGPQL